MTNNQKRWVLILMPSLLMVIFIFSSAWLESRKTFDEENKINKPLVLLVVGTKCSDCIAQEEIWNGFVEESPFPVEYKKVTLDDPVFKDVSNIMKIDSLPSVVTMSKTGVVTSSESGILEYEALSRMSAIALESKLTKKETEK